MVTTPKPRKKKTKPVTKAEIERVIREAAETVRHIVEREKQNQRGGRVDPNFFLGAASH